MEVFGRWESSVGMDDEEAMEGEGRSSRRRTPLSADCRGRAGRSEVSGKQLVNGGLVR